MTQSTLEMARQNKSVEFVGALSGFELNDTVGFRRGFREEQSDEILTVSDRLEMADEMHWMDE